MTPTRNPPLVAIVGPTAVGKTALALWLAERFAVEVVSADSRQVYRGMDIGTAKPTMDERRRLPHHLVDIVQPDQAFTLAQYQEMAYSAIHEVQGRNGIPLLVGGTGLYVRAVLEGLSIPRVEPDPGLRQELGAEAQVRGYVALHARLRQLDPVAAERIDPRNVRRVVRALEVCYALGQPMSSAQRATPPPYQILRIGLTVGREALYRRIDERIDRMVDDGLLEEVRALIALGYDYRLPSMSGLGYRQVGMYLRGDLRSLEEAVAYVRRDTRRFVRQQSNWFRDDDPSIAWFDASTAPGDAIATGIEAFLSAARRTGRDSEINLGIARGQ
jgi:tRNA dimethylallyltransferase